MDQVDEVIELNVGGRHLATLLSTLTKYQDSKLADMFRNRSTLPRDKDGRYFLDVDPDIFKHVLNFLRCRSLPSDDVWTDVKTYAFKLGIEELSKLLRYADDSSIARSLTQNWKKNIHGYEDYLNQIRKELISSYDMKSRYFYIQFSDESMHIISLCSIDGISDGHLVINVKYVSRKTDLSSLLQLLWLDLKKLNIVRMGENTFQPDSKCACRVAFKFTILPVV